MGAQRPFLQASPQGAQHFPQESGGSVLANMAMCEVTAMLAIAINHTAASPAATMLTVANLDFPLCGSLCISVELCVE